MGTDKTLKVCHVISGDLWAGAEVQAFELLRAMNRNQRVELSAIVLNEAKLARSLRDLGLEVHVIDESRHGFFKIVRDAKGYLTDKDVDIVHSHRYKENILAAYIKRAGMVSRLVQTVHGYPEPFRGLRNAKARVYQAFNRRYTNKYFDCLIAVSDDLRQKISQYVDRGRIVTIRNSIDPETVCPTRDRARIRSEFGLSADAPVVASAGRMVPVKAYEVFLRAARVIHKRMPHARFLLIGDGPERQALVKLAAQLHLEDIVIFPGYRDDIIDLLSAADIFAISSSHEGIPMVLLEALALGIPVVTTSVGGIKEVVVDGSSGLLVEAGDCEQLAAKCMRVLDDRELSATLSENGKQRVANEFSVGRQARKVEELYMELANEVR